MGTRIKQRRQYLQKTRRSGYTQREVAAHLGMSREGFAHYELGHNELNMTVIQKLAEVLDVPIGYFFDEVKNDIVEDDEVVQAYKGLDPQRKEMIAASVFALRDMHRKDDQDDALHGTTTGKRAE